MASADHDPTRPPRLIQIDAPFSSRLSRYSLNETLFSNMAEARRIIEAWRLDYNEERPHTSLNGLTPNEFAKRSMPDQNQNGIYL